MENVILIPKLMEGEIQLYVGPALIQIYTGSENEIISNIQVIKKSDGSFIKFPSQTVIDCEISVNPSVENVISINPKFRENLLSNDKIIRDIIVDIILEENKDFIDKYLDYVY